MNATLLLLIATLALVVGPLLGRLGRRLPGLAAAIDGATVGGIVVVAFLHLLPEAGAHVGWWAVVLFAVGLALPTLGERLTQRQFAQGWSFSMGGLVLMLLLLHIVTESAALASHSHDERISIATLLVIVGHRLPLGLFLWGQARRRMGLPWSIAVLGFVASAALLGPMLVPERFREGGFSAVLSALLAGGLLHLVLQHGPSLRPDGSTARARTAWSAVGALVAVGFFVPYLSGISSGHDHAGLGADLPTRLWELVQTTAIPLALGVLGAALIEAFMPGSIARWLSGGSRLRQALFGVAVGAPLPVCSCGVLPIYRSLIMRGVAPPAALALLIAAPEIGLDSILLSLPLLGTTTTLARLGSALVLALIVGLVVGHLKLAGAERDASGDDLPPAEDRPLRPLAAIRRGLLETWGHLSPWILFGLLATVLVEPWISTDWARALPPWAQVVALSLAGMPTYICATAATPFAALLLLKGFTPGAVIAFLLTGPATNVTTFGALRRIHSRQLALAFVITALAATVLLGVGVDLLLSDVQVSGLTSAHEGDSGPLTYLAAAFLGVLTAWVLFREGPRGFLAQLWPEGSSTREGRHHGHEHPEADARA